MKKTVMTSLLVVFTMITGFAQTINIEKSVVNFKIKNFKVKTVKGTFGGMKGKVNFNPNNISESFFNVCIDAVTVNTGNNKRDEHLQKEDYFDVQKYPTICFVSEKVWKTDGGYTVSGSLTMHGVTKKVQGSFTFSQNKFKGSGTINRLDYNIGDNGTFMVGNNVEIEIEAVLD